MNSKVCPICGKTFVPHYCAPMQTYCSKSCRQLAWEKYSDYRPTKTFVCANCGKSVTTNGAGDRRTKYCCEKCAREYKIKKKPKNKPVQIVKVGSRRKLYNYERIDEDLAEMVSHGARTIEAIHALQLPGSIVRKRASEICEGRNLRYTIRFLVTPNEIAKMRELAEQGLNFSEIAVRTERAENTVGKYIKANLTPEQIQEARQKVGRVKRICPNCKREYETSDSFCSDECYQEWRLKQGFKRPPNRFYCAKCGKLVDDSGKKTRFCSARCEKLYYKHPRKKGALLYEKNIGGREE